MIHVTIKTLDSQNYEFDVNEEATVLEFKEIIAKKINIPSHKQRLIFKGKVLQDDKVLNSYSVHDQVIHMVERHIPSSIQNEPTNSLSMDNGNAGERTHTAAQPRVFLGTVDIPLNNGNFDMTRFESALHQFAQNLTQTDYNQGTPSANGSIPNTTPTSSATFNGGNVSYSKQRLDIAQKMIEETKKELKKLKSSHTKPSTMEEDLDSDKPSTSQQIHSTEEVVLTTSTEGDANLENVTSNPLDENSKEKSSQHEPNNSTVSESGPTPTTTARPKTADMADLIEQYTGVMRDLLPYLDSTAQNLRITENFTDQGDKGARAQTEFNTISTVIHYLSHAQHAMSDIVVDFNETNPRYLRAAVLHQAYVPVEVSMPFNVAMPVHNLTHPNPNVNDQGIASDAPHTTHQMDPSSVYASALEPPTPALDSRPPRTMTVIVESRQMDMGSSPVPITTSMDTFTSDMASSMASSLASLVGGQDIANGENLAAHVEFRVEHQQPDQHAPSSTPDQGPQANPLLNAALGATLTPNQIGSGGAPNSLPTTSSAPTMSSYVGDDGSINISMAFPLPPASANLTPHSQTSTAASASVLSSASPSHSSASWSTQMAGTMRNLLSSIMPRFSNSAIPDRNGDTTSTTYSSNSSNRSRSVPRLSPRNRQSEAPFNQHIPFIPPFLEGMLNQHLNFVPTNSGSSSVAPGMGQNGPPNFVISYQQAGQGLPTNTFSNGPATLNPAPGGSIFSASDVDPLFSHNDPLLPCLSHHFVNLTPGSSDRIGFINVHPNHNGRFDWSRMNNTRTGPRRAPRNGVGVARPILRVSRNRTVPPPRNSRNTARPTRTETGGQTAVRQTRSQVIADEAPPTSSPPPQLLDIITSMFERMVNPDATVTSEISSQEGTDMSGLLGELFGGSNSSSPSTNQTGSGAMLNFLGALVGQFMIPFVTSNDNDQSTIQDGVGYGSTADVLPNLAPGSSIYDFLSTYTELFPELLESEGQTDLMSRFMLFAFQRTDFATLQAIFMRQPQALNHLNRLIVGFVLAQRPASDTPSQSTWPDKAELTDVVDRICRETLPFLEEIFRDIPTRDDIDVIRTIDAYQTCAFTTLLATVFNHTPSSTDDTTGFSRPEDLIDLIFTAERHLVCLLRLVLADPTRDIPIIVRRALTSSLWTGNNFASIFGGGTGGSANFVTDLLSRWLVSYLMPNTSQASPTSVETDFLPYFNRYQSRVGESKIDERSPVPSSQDEAVKSTLSVGSNIQDKRKITRMEIEEDENFQDALGYQDVRVSTRGDVNAGTVISGETEKDWKAQIPKEWGAIIENDVEKQKRESSSTPTNVAQSSSNRVDNVAIIPTRHFSNAYIAGMPAKRRKMMEAAQSTRLASPYLDEYLREVLDKALSDAGVFITLDEFEEIIDGMMLDQNLISAFHAMLASKMDMAIQSTDFCPTKFPDILKYIRKYLP